MADSPPDGGADPGVGPDQAPGAGTPRWVKVFAIIAAAVILLLVILLLTGQGHGPGRHTGSAGPPAPASVVTDHAPLADAGRTTPPAGRG